VERMIELKGRAELTRAEDIFEGKVGIILQNNMLPPTNKSVSKHEKTENEQQRTYLAVCFSTVNDTLALFISSLITVRADSTSASKYRHFCSYTRDRPKRRFPCSRRASGASGSVTVWQAFGTSTLRMSFLPTLRVWDLEPRVATSL